MVPALYAARGMGTANAVAQAAAIAALEDIETMHSRVKIIVNERERVQRQLSTMGVSVVSSSANFVMAAIDATLDSDDVILSGGAGSADALAAHLYDDAGILVNQTREAGLEKFIRFSISLPEHNDRLLASLAEFVHD